jgi:hypothetical protein
MNAPGVRKETPFTLSLSKGQRRDWGFDKLSPNGSVSCELLEMRAHSRVG